MGTRDQGNPPNGGSVTPSPPSHRYGSPGASGFGRAVARSPYPDPSEAGLALPHLPPGQGNINPFPFRRVPVRPRLRTGSLPADDHCRETLALPAGRILTSPRCYCRRDLHLRRVQRTSRPAFCPAAAPPYLVSLKEAHHPGIGARFEPRPIFGAPSLGG